MEDVHRGFILPTCAPHCVGLSSTPITLGRVVHALKNTCVFKSLEAPGSEYLLLDGAHRWPIFILFITFFYDFSCEIVLDTRLLVAILTAVIGSLLSV